MPCVAVPFESGVAFVRTSRERRVRCRFCSNWSIRLCDFELAAGKTCDAPLCHVHAKCVGLDRDLCPAHAKAASRPGRDAQTAPQLRLFALGSGEISGSVSASRRIRRNGSGGTAGSTWPWCERVRVTGAANERNRNSMRGTCVRSAEAKSGASASFLPDAPRHRHRSRGAFSAANSRRRRTGGGSHAGGCAWWNE